MPGPCRRVVTMLVAVFAATATALGVAAPARAMTHFGATAQLAAAGITWSSTGGCSDRNNPECTSFEGIRPSTIDGIITFKQASGCPVNITGGTEIGHADGVYSHWNGHMLDVALSTCIESHVGRHFTYVGYVWGWGYQYRAPSGNLYTKEVDHWDILYYTCGC